MIIINNIIINNNYYITPIIWEFDSNQPMDIVNYVRWRSSSSCSNQEMQLSTCGWSSSASAGTRRGISSEDHEKRAKTFIDLWIWYLLFHLCPPSLICAQYHCDVTVLGPQFPCDLVLWNKFVWKLNKLWSQYSIDWWKWQVRKQKSPIPVTSHCNE